MPTPTRHVQLIAWALTISLLVLALVQALAFATRVGIHAFWTAGPDAFGVLVAMVGCLLAATVVVVQPQRLEVPRLILTSSIWTVLLLGGLSGTWLLIDRQVRDVDAGGRTVLSVADVDAYLQEQVPALVAAAAEPIRIPTGLLIESIEFLSANDVAVSAFIWQRYGPAVPAEIPRGFSLPGPVAEAIDVLDHYQITARDGSVLMGWHVHVTLRQQLDYRKFPFDRQDLRIRIWPDAPDSRVILVPDFRSYPVLTPDALPGLSTVIVGGGWQPERSFFSYSLEADNANFGFPAGASPRGYPELHFNVSLKRSFSEPFLSDMLLAAVVALLLFAVVLLTTHDRDSRHRIGITTFGVLGTSGTLLFTVIVKHNEMRSRVAPGPTVYIEILPTLLYITIVLVAINAILVLALPGRVKVVDYHDNLLPDLLYWPLLLGALWLVTLLVFRP